MEKSITIRYKEYDIHNSEAAEACELLKYAIQATDTAYAPYSDFHVGAAVKLENGTIVTGSNQENVAYPSGLCAERVALFTASAQHPGKTIKSIAIVARNPQGQLVEASPCGACRQVMAEVQTRQKSPLQVITYIGNDRIRIIDRVDDLLPFLFEL